MTGLTPRALLCDLMDELDAKDGLSRNARAQRAFARRRPDTSLEDAVFQRVAKAPAFTPPPTVMRYAFSGINPDPKEPLKFMGIPIVVNSPSSARPDAIREAIRKIWSSKELQDGNAYLEALQGVPVNPWLTETLHASKRMAANIAAMYKPSPEKPMKESDYNNMMVAKHAENTMRAGMVPSLEPAADMTPIDTSTTAGKIAVMQAHAAGQCCERASKMWAANLATWCKLGQGAIDWNWEEYNYRIAPPPPAERKPRTELEAARGRLKQHPPEVDSDSDAGFLLSLVLEIDAAPLVTVSGNYVKQVHFELGSLQPGRYRLVRDDQ